MWYAVVPLELVFFRGCDCADVFAAGVARAHLKPFSQHQAEPVGHSVASLGCLFRVC